MGRLNNGLFGGFSGRVGNLVGYMLNGKSIVRTIGKSSKPLTSARKANCEEMTVVNTFLRATSDFIRSGFKLITAGTDKNFYNAAVSYNKKNALQGSYPNISMDYKKVLVSMGDLLTADKTTISNHENGIEFKWDVPADLARERRNDRAMLLIYFPDSGSSSYMLSGARRHEGKDVLYTPSNRTESGMESYISFMNDDGTEISDSVYAGSLNHDETELQDKPAAEDLKTPIAQQKLNALTAINRTTSSLKTVNRTEKTSAALISNTIVDKKSMPQQKILGRTSSQFIYPPANYNSPPTS